MIYLLSVSLYRSVPGWDYYKRQKLFYLRFPGDLLINMQKMMILPLVVSSMVSSLASLKGKASGKVAHCRAEIILITF